MLDALNRTRRYRELSAGCRRLATIGLSAETRNHFLQMAEHYDTLAKAEESSKIGGWARRLAGESGGNHQQAEKVLSDHET